MSNKPARLCVQCGGKAECKVKSPHTNEQRYLCRQCYAQLASVTNQSASLSPLLDLFESKPLPAAPAAMPTPLVAPLSISGGQFGGAPLVSSSNGGPSAVLTHPGSPAGGSPTPPTKQPSSGIFGRIRATIGRSGTQLASSSSNNNNSNSVSSNSQRDTNVVASNGHKDAETRRLDVRLGSNVVAQRYFPFMAPSEAQQWAKRQLSQNHSSTAEFVVHGLGENDVPMFVSYVFAGDLPGQDVHTVRVLSPPNELVNLEGAGEFESIHVYLLTIGVIAEPSLAGPWVPPLAALRRDPPLVPLLAMFFATSKQAADVMRAQVNIACLLTVRPTERQSLALIVRRNNDVQKCLIVREGDRYYFRPGDGGYGATITDLLRLAGCVDEKVFPPQRRASSHNRTPLPAAAVARSAPRPATAPPPAGAGGRSGRFFASISEAMRFGVRDLPPLGGDNVYCAVRLAKVAELDERHRDIDGTSLMAMPWYWGAMPSDVASRLLDGAPTGTFLMRTSVQRSPHPWALSVVQEYNNQRETVHVRVHRDVVDKRKYVRVEGYPSMFPTVREMVAHVRVLVNALPRRADNACQTAIPMRVYKPPIGKGATGVVYKAHVEMPELDGGGCVVAVKQLRAELEGNADEQSAMAREVDTMLMIPSHPNIVALLGIVIQTPLGIVTEFLGGGSLDAKLYREKFVFSHAEQRRLASEIACGVAFLHENNIVHRDLATRNILLTERLVPKVSDFGMSRMLGDEKYNYSLIDMGPIRWMAPEQLKRKQGSSKSVYAQSTDVFSFAMLLVEIVTNQLPWPQLGNVEAALAVCSQERPEIATELAEPTVWRVITTCWAHEPSERMTMQAVYAMLTGSNVYDDVDDIPTPQSSSHYDTVEDLPAEPPTFDPWSGVTEYRPRGLNMIPPPPPADDLPPPPPSEEPPPSPPY
jgi:serine/threonine protein kinase